MAQNLAFKVLWFSLIICIFAGFFLHAVQFQVVSDQVVTRDVQVGLGAIQNQCEDLVETLAEEILSTIHSQENKPFDCRIIRGKLDISVLPSTNGMVVISVPISITNSIFTEPVIFKNASFNSTVVFSGTQFESIANFHGAHFMKEANFSRVEFKKDAFFDETKFQSEGVFIDTVFYSSAQFTSSECGLCTFVSTLIDGETTFFGNALFNKVHFVSRVEFINVKFSEQVFFDDAQFEGIVSFLDTNFAENATFNNINVKGNITFQGSTFSKAFEFLHGSFDHEVKVNFKDVAFEGIVNFDTDAVKLFNSQDQVLILKELEDIFRSQKDLKQENQAFYQRMLIVRSLESHWIKRAFELVFLDIPFGYGIRPWRVVATSLLIILIFAAFYYPRGVIRVPPLAPPEPRSQKSGIPLSELPLAYEGEFPDEEKEQKPISHIPPLLQRIWYSDRLHQAWEAFTFSFGIFTKLSFRKRVATRFREIVILEWFIGLFMIAGFLYTLSKTVPLLHAILDSIF